jgi:hypothetical protein
VKRNEAHFEAMKASRTDGAQFVVHAFWGYEVVTAAQALLLHGGVCIDACYLDGKAEAYPLAVLTRFACESVQSPA